MDYTARLLAEDFNVDTLKNIDFQYTTTSQYTNTRNLWEYFQVYPYQTFTLLIYTGLYKIGISPLAFNVLSLWVSYVFIYLIAKKVVPDNFRPLLTAFIAALFPVFYVYTPIYYTDTLSMPFTVLCVYFAITALEHSRKNAHKFNVKMLISTALSAVFLTIGYSIKGSVIVLLPALLIFFLLTGIVETRHKKILLSVLRFKKRLIKTALVKKLQMCAVLAVVFVGVNILVGTLMAIPHIYTDDSRYEYEFPKIHWVMMGMQGNGGYSDNDYHLTFSSGNKDEKTTADKTVLKQRIKDYKPQDFITLIFFRKATRTWCDGTYFINHNYLSNNFINSDIFKYSANVLNYALLIMLVRSFWLGARNGAMNGARKNPSPKNYLPYTLLFRIILCGIFLLLLAWETRSRYLINFTPFLLLLQISDINKSPRSFS
jgi:4-amino-4-deoxy-L-arabinose transferase-like glycosyltransferase